MKKQTPLSQGKKLHLMKTLIDGMTVNEDSSSIDPSVIKGFTKCLPRNTSRANLFFDIEPLPTVDFHGVADVLFYLDLDDISEATRSVASMIKKHHKDHVFTKSKRSKVK